MPCDDITDTLELWLDPDDKIEDYALTKRTCGAEVGHQAFLMPLVEGMVIDELARSDYDFLLPHTEGLDDDQNFLAFKHFIALREAATALTGRASDASAFTLSVTAHEQRGLFARGFVSVSQIEGTIKACGHCRSCGSRKKAPESGEAQVAEVSAAQTLIRGSN